MPKASIQIPGSRKMQTVNRKFKLGGRKSTVGALGLTTEQLVEKYENTDRGRDAQKISNIVVARGFDVKVLLAEREAAKLAAEQAEAVTEAA